MRGGRRLMRRKRTGVRPTVRRRARSLADFTSAAQGRAAATSRGMRSCRSSSVALIDRLGMEPRPHHAVQQGVGDGDDRHALMMRHEGADNRDPFALGQRAPACNPTPRRTRSGPVRPISAKRSQIGDRRSRIDHRSQSRGVGRDHPVLPEASFQSEAGNAEIRILIGQFQIARVIGGFGYAPGQAAVSCA